MLFGEFFKLKHQPCVNGDWPCQWEMAIFDPSPHRIHTPLTDHREIGTGDYVGDPYGCAAFDAIPPMGGTRQMSDI